MSEIDPNEHEEIARRLREDGQAQAPSDLAGEVMKRVRSEPRRSTSSVRRPLVTLLAAALVVVALVAGLAKLGGGSASSAGGSSGGGGGGEKDLQALRPGAQGAAGKFVQSKVVRGIPRKALVNLRGRVTFSAALSDTPNALCVLTKDSLAGTFDSVGGLTLDVPYVAWYSVQTQLTAARKEAVGAAAPLVTVRLRRLAPGATTNGAATCP